MPSPFPGMDPYIEGWIWGDFHARMAAAICEQLNSNLPDSYVASTDSFVRRVDPSSVEQVVLGKPDVFFSSRQAKVSGRAATTLPAPRISVLPGVVAKQRYVKVLDSHARRVVSVIELLSPSNKTPGKDRDAYLYKRDEYIGAGINLVEIDLLRNGYRPPVGDPGPPDSDYAIIVQRGGERGQFSVWPFSVRNPRPSVIVPLDPGVEDAMLDIKVCLDHVYDSGRYQSQLDYDNPPDKPLQEADAARAREILQVQRPRTEGGE
jgi:uncharacterized protein DUF4058